MVSRHLVKRIFFVLGLCFVVALSIGYFYSKGGGELPVYTTAIERMVIGEEIYRREDTKAFTYPPFAAIPFVPFLGLPKDFHPALWYVINICSFIYVFRRLNSLLLEWLPGEQNKRGRMLFWVLLIVLVGRYLSSVFETKANDIIILILMFESARMAALERDNLLGLWTGLGAAFKATPWLFLPVLIWQKKFLAALILFTVALAAHLLPDILFPRALGGSWTLSWYYTFLNSISLDKPVDVAGAWTSWNHLNQSLTATLYRLSTPIDPVKGIGISTHLWSLEGRQLLLLNIVAQLLVIFLVILANKPILNMTGLKRFGQVGAVLCGMLLLSPMSSKSHFAILIVPISFCILELIRDRRKVIIGTQLGIIFFVSTLTTKDIIGRQLGNEVLALGSVTWITLITLIATTYALHRNQDIIATRCK